MSAHRFSREEACRKNTSEILHVTDVFPYEARLFLYMYTESERHDVAR